MNCENKKLECLLKIRNINKDILEFGERGILDKDIPDCSGCDYLNPLTFENETLENYCTNSEIIQLYKEIQNKPCCHLNLECLTEKDKKRIRLLLNQMALDQTRGKDYKRIKQEFIEINSELCKNGTDRELIRELVHVYNNIRLIKEVPYP